LYSTLFRKKTDGKKKIIPEIFMKAWNLRVP
jgi:hypothetical protein